MDGWVGINEIQKLFLAVFFVEIVIVTTVVVVCGHDSQRPGRQPAMVVSPARGHS